MEDIVLAIGPQYIYSGCEHKFFPSQERSAGLRGLRRKMERNRFHRIAAKGDWLEFSAIVPIRYA